MANNRKANRCRRIQRVPMFDLNGKLIGYCFIKHLNYSRY